ncbi:hypothetical protein vseg_000822 [Gypsophila vaccaria]
MVKLGFWNVKGLNSSAKHKEIKLFMHSNKVELFGLLETRVKNTSMNKVVPNVCSGRSFCTNICAHPGGRIWMLWNPDTIQVDAIECDSQSIHSYVTVIANKTGFWFTLIYGLNSASDRALLWTAQLRRRDTCRGPWLWCGDFNAICSIKNRIGAPVQLSEIRPLLECLRNCGMQEMKATGSYFTWSNKQEAEDRVYSKIDWVFQNDDGMLAFPEANAHFLPEGVFDHCPCIMTLWESSYHRPKAFKYFNMWSLVDEFPTTVAQYWNQPVAGTLMFQLVSKLKILKGPLKKLNHQRFSNVEVEASHAKTQLTTVQELLQKDPSNLRLLEEEKEATQYYSLMAKARDSFLRQKSKAQWGIEGDSNSPYFHCCIKARRSNNKVLSLTDDNGLVQTDPKRINQMFEDYYMSLLGSIAAVQKVHSPTVALGPLITAEHMQLLTTDVTEGEVKSALFSIQGNKAPGPDGYSSQFFQDAWDTVGADVFHGVEDFFKTGKLLKQLNHTLVTLIPKKDRPTSVIDFRPIACCNVVYKILSKVLCNRLSLVLPDIVSLNQSAFIKGRQIVENVLICQDLVRLYGRSACSPRAILKIDLKKAYDSVEWCFLLDMLTALGFPTKFRELIMVCVTTTSYTLYLNGSHFGYFKGKRGLRQGDPLSPLLFTLCMKYLSRIHLNMRQRPGFRYHPLCKKMQLTHLCFVDDLVMFSRGDQVSITLLLSAFSSATGLTMNRTKSHIYFNGVPRDIISHILATSGMSAGQFPFRYLGVPISSKKLFILDCEVLIDKVVARIRSWGARKLSYAGRVVLIKSVLSSLHSYWATIFVIPAGIIKRINSICNAHLWSGMEHHAKPANVSWDNVCHPIKAGGLGIVQAKLWNKAAVGEVGLVGC